MSKKARLDTDSVNAITCKHVMGLPNDMIVSVYSFLSVNDHVNGFALANRHMHKLGHAAASWGPRMCLQWDKLVSSKKWNDAAGTKVVVALTRIARFLLEWVRLIWTTHLFTCLCTQRFTPREWVDISAGQSVIVHIWLLSMLTEKQRLAMRSYKMDDVYNESRSSVHSDISFQTLLQQVNRLCNLT